MKVAGKRFKRFVYSPEEFVGLLQCYFEKIEKIKAAEKNKILAEVTESTGKFGSVTFYAVGYINEKYFTVMRYEHLDNDTISKKNKAAKKFRQSHSD